MIQVNSGHSIECRREMLLYGGRNEQRGHRIVTLSSIDKCFRHCHLPLQWRDSRSSNRNLDKVHLLDMQDHGAKLCVDSELDDSLKIERIAFNATLSWNLTSDHTPAVALATKSSLLKYPFVSYQHAHGRTQSVRKFLVSYADGRLLLLRTNGTLLRDMTLSSQLFDIRTGVSSLCHIVVGGKQGSIVRKEPCPSRPQGWDFHVRQRQNQTSELLRR